MDFSKTKLSADRSLWSYSKVQNVVAAFLRNRPFQLSGYPPRDLYLNVGCGPFPIKDFCNIDYGWRPGVHSFDIVKGIPLPSGSVKGIFTEHCLEHVSHSQCLAVLRDFRRLLEPGGVARIVVPDGELYCRWYVRALSGETVEWPYAENGKLPMYYVNRIMRHHGHQFIYDFDTMKESLLAAGFREVYKQAYGRGCDPKLLVELEYRAVESLYIEGTA
jgi:predicted SAM-dependent methyltransferase